MEKRLRKKEKKCTIKGRYDGLLKNIEGDLKGERTIVSNVPSITMAEERN